MPRLVEINAACNTGSTGHIAEAIGLLAQQDGWEVLYVHGGRYVCPSSLPTVQVQSRMGDYVHGLFSLLTGHHGCFSTRATRRLIEKLRLFRPDIIHLHNLHGYYLDYRLLFGYLREADIPVLWTWHDCWAFTGHCACYATETGVCEAWKTGCSRCPKLSDYPRALRDGSAADYRAKKQLFTALRRLTVVPVSRWMEQNAKQSFFRSVPTVVIPNGIDLQVFCPRADRSALRAKWGVRTDKYVLLGVAAQWNARKGYADMLSLAAMEECQVVLVGLTGRQVRTLPAGVVGIEHTGNGDQLAELYSLADLFVNPTYSDTFPTTHLEALACGTPVLTYASDGAPEALTPEVGVVVGRGDRQALRDAVRRLQVHPLDRGVCADYARARFDKNECFKSYIQLYNRLLSHA